MADIVERLRNLEWMIDQKELNEAADEIERLREAVNLREDEIEWLRKQLIAFHEMSNRPIVYTFTEEAAKALKEKE